MDAVLDPQSHRALEVGTWRSRHGDSWPHVGTPVELDYWPQGTHLVHHSLVLCASGGGGGSQQATFRSALDPILGQTLDALAPPGTARELHERWVVRLDQAFLAARGQLAGDQLQASAVGLWIGASAQEAVLGHVGMERAWRLRGAHVERLTQDDVLPPPLDGLPASWVGNFGGTPSHWKTRVLDLEPGDVLLLASGVRDTGLGEAEIAAALSPRQASAAGHAQAVGAACSAFVDVAVATPAARWRWHSRAAIAVVRVG